MDAEPNYFAQTNHNINIKKLELFLDKDKFNTCKGNPYTNITNQFKGITYCILTNINSVDSDDLSVSHEENTIINILRLQETAYDDDGDNFVKNPMDELMFHLENCRISGAPLNFSEQQYYKIPGDIKNLKDKLNTTMDDPKDIVVNKSGIDFDFDFHQKEEIRAITDSHFYALMNAITKIICDTLDLDSCNNPIGVIDKAGDNTRLFNFYAVVLKKPDVVEHKHPEFGRCFKESFRIRIPGIKITKEHKKYIMRVINEHDILPNCMHDIHILTKWNDIIDVASPTHPIMILGSSKRGSLIPHEFYKLYRVTYKENIKMITLRADLPDFTPTPYVGPPIKIKNPADGRCKIIKKIPDKYKYNLCYELSINYESANGLILKREFDPLSSLETEIKTNAERFNGSISKEHLILEIRNNVTDLAVRNYEAKYLQKILDILKPDRVREYNSWIWIIYLLAWTNPDYKPLAIWFSYRFPGSWNNGGMSQLEENWEWALNHQGAEDNPENRTIATIYAWAKEDNPKAYHEIQEFNAFIVLKDLLFKNTGLLNDHEVAIVLKAMFGKKFICDVNPKSKSNERKWYEFVFPTDELGRTKNSIYKWRLENGKPDNLDRFIAVRLPENIRKVMDWVDIKISESVTNEETQKYYELMKKNMVKTMFDLGKDTAIKKIINRCEVEFRERGFEETLDTNTDHIGVGNGVLKVFPVIEMIERYHEIPITRSTNVNYIPYDPEDPCIKELETEIKRLFAGEEDAYEKTICYLASSLDGRKRIPLFFIWLGEGGNGKSFLLELHINTLREVVNGGYGAKLNVAFFTQDKRGSGGPDSEKMMLKHARFAYCSESEAGETLQMSKIKEFTSETLSGNEKHLTQDMFEANCHFVFCSNNDPRITGKDWGTWRRILVYRFKMRFVENPDPNDPYEHKLNKKFVETVTKDPKYKQAYLSILVHYYEIYRNKYSGNLADIKSKSIERDTKNYQGEQDTVSRFINEQVIYLGKCLKTKDVTTGELEKVVSIPITDIAAKYIIWHGAKVDNKKMLNAEVIKHLKSSSLKKYIYDNGHGEYLMEHICLNLGDNYEEINIEKIENEKVENKKIEDKKKEVEEFNNIDYEEKIKDEKKEVYIDDLE